MASISTHQEEQRAPGPDGDHALFVRRRPENQAADGGEQRLCLPSPPSPVFLHHRRRNGAAAPTVTLTVSVRHVLLSPTNSASERRTTRSPHCSKQEGSVVSPSWLVKCCTKWKFTRGWLPASLGAHQVKKKKMLFKESFRQWQCLRCLFCCQVPHDRITSVKFSKTDGYMVHITESWALMCESMSATKAYFVALTRQDGFHSRV